MPWSIFNRPSIQLSSLKSYLDRESDITTEIFHPYLHAAAAIGGEQYHYLAGNSWAGEALYSPLLFPEQFNQAEKLFYTSCRDEPHLKKLSFTKTVHALDNSLEQWLDSMDFSTFRLFGFSICFNQLLSSLAAAARIKKRYPEIKIVIGGSGCVDKIGVSLLKNFSQIDYVINGEGERALLDLYTYLSQSDPAAALPGQILNRDTKHIPEKPCSGIADLNTLPLPDFAPYFQEMQQQFPSHPFIPVLPLEFSRGCWWNKCTFCNLNLQWHGYRLKNAATMLREVQQQSDRHGCLDFCFTDNALPPKETETFFQTLAAGQKDYDFFAEIRVITEPEPHALYRKGGLSTVQVGIEALSTSLLNRMDKGTSVIENIASMRQCAESGICLEGNIITEFPGSTAQEVEETLTNLDFVLPYAPLSSASFFLGHGSPVADNPGEYGISAVIQHANNKKMIPAAILQNLDMLIKDYRGDRTRQRKQWQAVKTKILQWQQFHISRDSKVPPLSYRDGGTFLLIRQERDKGRVLHHRLKGTSRKIYLHCRTIRDTKELLETFPGLKEKVLLNFLNDLLEKKLLFSENNRFLALAIKNQ